MKKFLAVFLIIFLLAACAGGKSDSEPEIFLEAVIHLDGMELIRLEIDSYEMLDNGFVIIHSGGISYITSPNNVVIIEYNLDLIEILDIVTELPEDESFQITGKLTRGDYTE